MSIVIPVAARSRNRGCPVSGHASSLTSPGQPCRARCTLRTIKSAATCADCSALDVELDGSMSFDPDGDAHTYLWSENTGSVTFGNRYSAITDLFLPAQPAEYGVTTTVVYEIDLEVADCEQSDTDTMNVTYQCTGERP